MDNKYTNLIKDAEKNSDLIWSFAENIGMPVEYIKSMNIVSNMTFNDIKSSVHFELKNKALCVVPKAGKESHGIPVVIVYVDGSLKENDG